MAKKRLSRKSSSGPTNRHFVVVTGLSGSGKSQAIKALEDLGYFCVDNLPTTLILTLSALSRHPGTEISKVAMVVDVREGKLLSQFPRVFRRLKTERDLKATLLFLEANDATLIRRFSETRRPHPLGNRLSVVDGLEEERRQLDAIRQMADEIIDTSKMTVHSIRKQIMTLVRAKASGVEMIVTVLSFGFKHGLPLDSDLVFDVRFLPNPYFVARLKSKTGKHRSVANYLKKFPETQGFLDRVTGLLSFLVPQYLNEGKSYLTIAIGCTGGRHRSVSIAEELSKKLTDTEGVQLKLRHRDIEAD